jgi:hypothetical protein
MPVTYVVHPGTVTLQNGSTQTLTAAELAALYGLTEGEYISSVDDTFVGSHANYDQIDLWPRTDGKYRNIKTLLGDNGTNSHWDKMTKKNLEKDKEP